MEKQANSSQCFVCGVNNPVGLHLKFYQPTTGEVTADFLPPEHFQGYPGVLHGGIVATILDETAGRSLMGLASPRLMFTAKLEIKYRKNVPVGSPLVARGKAGNSRGRTAEAWSGIYNPAGELLAEAQVLLVDIPNPPSSQELEATGWKIYPD